ncbi:hypothetical protein LIER_25771 [Lithospermum erythrorhizon]|uniref:Uncharacterized protein n=1 Tax=Lithospermum erythrorhizon TaxID=34254 RepID=A0AAV3R7G4_LITER
MSSCKSSATHTKSKLSVSSGTPCEDPSLFRSLARALQYLTFTRPDISYAIQQILARGHVRVLHVPSRYQIAGIFTKGLPLILFTDFQDSSLIVRPPPAPTEGVY